jgi:hypothetical protein
MKLKSLIGGVVGLFTVLWLGGCTMFAYMNPMTGEKQLDPPSSQDVAAAQSNPNSFASNNPGADFSQKAEYGVDAYGARTHLIPPIPTLSQRIPAPPAINSPTGTPGVSAAGAAATTGPMIGSPPPPPSISPKVH